MMSITYSSYLKLDELLALQRSDTESLEHDEMLFIIIHQVYELWFKVILHELDYLKHLLVKNNSSPALHTLKRVLTIMKTLVGQFDILETMTPSEFMSFRDRLESSSGFESYQFRELEFLLGLKDRRTLAHFPEGSAARQRLETRYAQPSLWDTFLTYLTHNGYDIPQNSQTGEPEGTIQPSPRIQQLLIDIYENNPKITQVCERLVDLDEGIQEWRYRHVIMVERTIGNKRGTGGSTGVDYLRGTLFKPIFPDLWAIRTEL